MNEIHIIRPEDPFEDEQNEPEYIECELCFDREAKIKLSYDNPERIEYACKVCFHDPDYQKIVKRDNPKIREI